MRRQHSEVTDPQAIERVLNSATIGRMATVGADGYPYVTPVNFVYYDGAIYFHCAPDGEKLDNIARNSRVCFQVDVPLAYLDSAFTQGRACKIHQFFHCVIIRGEASVVPDGRLKIDVLNALSRKREPNARIKPVTEDLTGYQNCKVVQIKPATMTMKSDLGQNRSAADRLAVARYLATRGEPGDIETVIDMGFDPAVLRTA
ncbi:MAG: pyridoxamine 5'-phosphate oxidase family protein [Dehalococcoidia bacterium]|nr:pyridoxamine 5'-phosphate oxidase family protein [Dehalococcoidia bacterium]